MAQMVSNLTNQVAVVEERQGETHGICEDGVIKLGE